MLTLVEWANLLNIKKVTDKPTDKKVAHCMNQINGSSKRWWAKHLGVGVNGVDYSLQKYCHKNDICHVKVVRYKVEGLATLSRISILFPGASKYQFICNGLEDLVRDKKIRHETAIPAGTYKISSRKVGGFNGRYTKRFPIIHKGMFHIINVPGYKYILVHVGNTPKDTSGCLLVGTVKPTFWSKLVHSVAAYRKFYVALLPHVRERNVLITFTEE